MSDPFRIRKVKFLSDGYENSIHKVYRKRVVEFDYTVRLQRTLFYGRKQTPVVENITVAIIKVY